MGNSDGQILYQYGGISTIVAEINSFISSMNTTLDDVEAQGRAVLGAWEGQTADGFNVYVQRWNKHAYDIALILSRLKDAVDNGKVDMQQTDVKLANSLFPH